MKFVFVSRDLGRKRPKNRIVADLGARSPLADPEDFQTRQIRLEKTIAPVVKLML